MNRKWTCRWAWCCEHRASTTDRNGMAKAGCWVRVIIWIRPLYEAWYTWGKNCSLLLFFLNFRVTEETRCCSYKQSGIFTLHRTFSAQCREWQNTCTRVKGVIMLAFNLYLSCSCLLSLCKPARTNLTAHNQLFRTMGKAFWTNSHRAHISWIWIFHHCPGDVKEVGQGARSPRGSHLWNFAQFINTSC